MPYVLYYSPGSSNLVVRMVLEELGVAYSDTQVPRKRLDRDREFLQLNPRGLVPVVVDKSNDAVIFETGAIILYLADQNNGLIPSLHKAAERGDCLKWLFMLSNTLHADLNFRFYLEHYVGDGTDKLALYAINQRRILDHLWALDVMIGEHSSSSFLGSGLSVCDFYLGCLVRWAQIYPRGYAALGIEELLEFKHLTNVLYGLQERPSVLRALQREGIPGPAFMKPDLA